MRALAPRRLTWPLLTVLAVVSTVVGSRVSPTQPIPSLLGVIMTTLGIAVLVALPGLATLALLSRRSLSAVSRLGVFLSGSGLAAFADFWAWIPSPTLGRVVAAAFLVASLAVIATARPLVLLDDPELRTALGIMLVVALGYIGLAYSQGGLGGAHWTSGAEAGNTTLAMAYRYWIAPDNTLPLLFAQRLVSHGPLAAPIPSVPGWHFSDRPPLQTGFILAVYPLFGLKSFASQLLGTVLQALWVPALWVLLRSRGISTARVLFVVICTAATGTIFFNTIYIWPKMLAGAMALVALAVLLERGSLVLAAVLAALSILAHGGAAFALLAMLPLVWRLRPSRIQVGLALAAGAVVYLPWMAYQHFLDPPGDYLLKWQLAGVIAHDRHSFLHDLVHAYTGNPLHAFVIDKLINIERFAYIPAIWANVGACCAGTWSGVVGTARTASQASLLVAIGPLLLGVVGLASPTIRRSLRSVRPLLLFVLLCVAIWVVVEYGQNPAGTVISQGPYTLLVLSVALAALATSYLPTWAAAVVASASLVWFAFAWFPGFGFRPAQPGIAVVTEWSMIALGLASLAVVGYLLWRSIPVQTGREAGETPQVPEHAWRSAS